MPVSPSLSNALSRVRAWVGDNAEPPMMPGGDVRYRIIIAEAATLHEAITRAARLLRAALIAEPQRFSDLLGSEDYTHRDTYLAELGAGRISTGEEGDPALTATTTAQKQSGYSSITVKW
jgi:hypothetical protein